MIASFTSRNTSLPCFGLVNLGHLSIAGHWFHPDSPALLLVSLHRCSVNVAPPGWSNIQSPRQSSRSVTKFLLLGRHSQLWHRSIRMIIDMDPSRNKQLCDSTWVATLICRREWAWIDISAIHWTFCLPKLKQWFHCFHHSELAQFLDPLTFPAPSIV